MAAHKFNAAKLAKLNDPARMIDLKPDVIWEAFGVSDPERVVELGAGTGMFAREFAERMSGGVIYAVDNEPLMLEWMREHLPPEADGGIIIMDASVDDVPLPSSSVDLVYSINLHHELDEGTTVLREAMRLLRPGGVLGIVDWRLEDSKPGPPVEHRIGGAAIVQQAEDAGFAGVRMLDVLGRHDVVVGRKLG